MKLYLRSALTCFTVICILAGPPPVWGHHDLPQAEKPAFEVLPTDLVKRAMALRERALAESKAYDILAELTTEVGPRFAGTTNDRRAVEWAQRKLIKLGFRNVRAEEVTVPCWVRGKAAGEITSPPRRQIEPLALGGSVPTVEGGIEAEVIEVAGLEELAKLDRSQVAGKIVFISRRMRRSRNGSGYGEVVPIRRNGPVRAAAQGAVAVLIRPVATSNSREAHTGMTHYQKGVPKIPAAALSNPDADLLEARIRTGETVRFRLELGCRTMPDTTSANVIGEIPGRECPKEIVLLVAHLDSWDLGTGTLDDGAGCAIIIETARLIGELEQSPRRTIRVWLSANEEFGLSGGLAYAKRYAHETNHYIAAMEADFGAGRAWELLSRVASEAQPAVRDLALLLAPLGIEYRGNSTLGGADLLPMMRYRLPLFELCQDATNYFDAYHSAGDTLDKADPRDLAQVVAAYAVVVLVATEIDGGFGRPPKFRGRLPFPFDRIAEGKELSR